MNKSSKAAPPTDEELSSAARLMGAKGGRVRTQKGFAAMSRRKRMAIIKLGTRAAAAARTARARERRRAEGKA